MARAGAMAAAAACMRHLVRHQRSPLPQCGAAVAAVAPSFCKTFARSFSGANGGGNGDDGDDPNSSKKQWRQWVERRLSANEGGDKNSSPIGLGGISNQEGVYPDSMEQDTDDIEARLLGDEWNKPRKTADNNEVEEEEVLWNMEFGAKRRSSAEKENVVDGDGEYDDVYGDFGEGTTNHEVRAPGRGGVSRVSFNEDDIDVEIKMALGDPPLINIQDLNPGLEEGKEYWFRPYKYYETRRDFFYREEINMLKSVASGREKPKKAFSVQSVITRADFRNVRFLMWFTGESGNILARKEFKMRAKSKRRIVRAIKTARAFGLLPFSNMGHPYYRFGRVDNMDAAVYTDADEDVLA